MRRTKGPTVVLSNHQKTLPLNLAAIRCVAKEILDSEFRLPGPELSIAFVTDEGIARLNEQFLNHHGPTDVITFEHGEIVISTDRAVAQSKQFQSPLHEELVRYVIHGLLHLAGDDDTIPSLRRHMHRRQERILRSLRKKLDLTLVFR